MCELPWSPLPPGNYARPPRTLNKLPLASAICCSAGPLRQQKAPLETGLSAVALVRGRANRKPSSCSSGRHGFDDNNSGSLAIFAAMRLASSIVSTLAMSASFMVPRA